MNLLLYYMTMSTVRHECHCDCGCVDWIGCHVPTHILDRVSYFDTYIRSGVTFWQIYIGSGFTFRHTNNLGLGFIRGPLVIITFMFICHPYWKIVRCLHNDNRTMSSAYVCLLCHNYLYILCLREWSRIIPAYYGFMYL